MRPLGLVINTATASRILIEMIADRLVTSQPYGGMPNGH